MNKKKSTEHQSPDPDWMEQWLRDFFLDPHTEYEDNAIFKIDIYETDDHWIVEAVLQDYASSEIKVKVENSKLMISAQKQNHSPLTSFPKKERIIDFPFVIIRHGVTAVFQNGLLEIFITKAENGSGKNRYIPLP